MYWYFNLKKEAMNKVEDLQSEKEILDAILNKVVKATKEIHNDADLGSYVRKLVNKLDD